MKTIAAIRTNKWTEEEERLVTSLKPYFGSDLVVVFHDRPVDVVPPIQTLDINDQWVTSSGLRTMFDWGWRCGDYSYYRLLEEFPDDTVFWLVEPDVYFSCDASDFFSKFDGDNSDALGFRLQEYTGPRTRVTKGLGDMPLQQAIFALTRFSANALRYLLDERVKYSASRVSNWQFANDELFAFSYLKESGAFTLSRIEDIAPGFLEEESFRTDPDVLVDTVLDERAEKLAGKIFHPIRGKQSFLNAVGSRVAANKRILRGMSKSIAYLDDKDVDDIAKSVEQEIRNSLNAFR